MSEFDDYLDGLWDKYLGSKRVQEDPDQLGYWTGEPAVPDAHLLEPLPSLQICEDIWEASS